ncbi:MAG: EAL and HDOD domain-containing protein [Phycisphaerales bacterium JB038]
MSVSITDTDHASPAPNNLAFVGRQPILDTDRRVYGYELLFRSGAANAYTATDGDHATCTTINNSLNIVGLSELVAGRLAFINMTRELLVNDFYTVLPPEHTVIELLENIEPDAEVLAACTRLKQAGYTLALDDFVFEERYAPLIGLADIIKIDLTLTPVEAGRQLMQRAPGVTFLAEKIETQAEFARAQRADYTLFQGYFFAKPEVIEHQDIPAAQQNYILLLQEVAKPTLDLGRIERIIRSDPSFSLKLLRYINSASHGIRNKIESIRHAMLMLGDTAFRKWASLLAATCVAQKNAEEPLRNCLTRADFCDRVSNELDVPGSGFDLFFFGMLSGLEAVMLAPLPRIIAELPLDQNLRDALLGDSDGTLHDLLHLLTALERVEIDRIGLLAPKLNISESRILEAHEEAIRFSDATLGSTPGLGAAA